MRHRHHIVQGDKFCPSCCSFKRHRAALNSSCFRSLRFISTLCELRPPTLRSIRSICGRRVFRPSMATRRRPSLPLPALDAQGKEQFMSNEQTHYQTVQVNGLNIFCREAGPKNAPAPAPSWISRRHLRGFTITTHRETRNRGPSRLGRPMRNQSRSVEDSRQSAICEGHGK